MLALDKAPIFADAKIILQPNVCFVHSRRNNCFDIFNRGAISFMQRMDGARTGNTIINEIFDLYPNQDKSTIETDYLILAHYLEARGYLKLNTKRHHVDGLIELGNRHQEVKPVHAEIELTRNCNLSCAYCYANAKKGKREDDLPLERWYAILQELRANGLRAVKISGGEPFLYPNIRCFLEFCAEHFIVSLNTNGWFINSETAEWLSKLKLQCVQVSLDSSTYHWHDRVRGKDSWKKAMEAIRNLSNHKVPLRISSTIGTENRSEISLIGEIAKQYNADTNFEIMKPTGRASGLKDKWFLENACDVIKHNPIMPIYKSLKHLEIKCQAQLGFIGVSSHGNAKPCNLPETFFRQLDVDVITPIETNCYNYSRSSTYQTTDACCSKVVAALPRQGGHTSDRCIFYHEK